LIAAALLSLAGAPLSAQTQFLYQANYSGSVSAYAVNAVAGALTPVAGSPFAAGTNASSVAVTPGGLFVVDHLKSSFSELLPV